MINEKIKLPIIAGPTASGKSSLALAVAQELDGEIVSCDSMQIYKRMNIGTAKPTDEEMRLVRHHMIDVVEPHESFSCADYARLASAAIEDIVSRGKTPIVCGGTGLYLDALLRGGMPECSDSDPAYREEMTRLAAEKGNEYVHAILRELDPESADAIHPNNVKRVVRALEICHVTGRKKSDIDRENSSLDSVYDTRGVWLCHKNRDVLYSRIEKRIDIMIGDGLLDEVRALDSEGIFEKSKTAAGAIGYKELLTYLRGETSLDEAVADLKTATRRYAKRQITWFSSKPYMQKIELEDEINEKILKNIVKNVCKHFK